MAEIRPFRGLRYTAPAGSLASLVAPPYDVITPAERIAFGAQSPYNITHLTLPEGKIDDRSKFIKYARASALLSEWRRENVLAADEVASLYRYTQQFVLGAENQRFTRTSLLCLIKLEPFSNGVVLPHEHTFPSHKEDRLRLLEATHAHLESIFGLYEDPSRELHEKILRAPVGPSVQVDTQDLVQTLEPIVDPSLVSELVAAFADKRIWIADGHHRYETALAFREALGERAEPVPEDYILIALSSMSDPGLLLLPTHRVVPALKDITIDRLIESLEPDFSIERCHSSRLVMRLTEAEAAGKTEFGIALEGGHGLWLTPIDQDALTASMEGSASDRLRRLGATILHKVILERRLGLSATATINFTRDAAKAVLSADEGTGAAFLMTPPTLEDMKQIALSGERMPHKSTYYFPKIWSGFAAWSLEEFAI
jgi:uncharacterized protein (DUF1015 family)